MPMKKPPSALWSVILVGFAILPLTFYLRHLGLLGPHVFLLMAWVALLAVMIRHARAANQSVKQGAIVITGFIFCALIGMHTHWVVTIGAFFVLIYLGEKTKVLQRG
ncbi:hypothetical protein SLT36_07720 [Aminobacter sp. BA135]|uniref:hypothetical protein n=1 Tax=Aminobacter sp. BA135 TaxID=537596 RepID=UPI003D7B9E7D